ncbi:hypothetical protein UFOVP606_8 [uncultured Caudovirales phage]|uniref:Uncharacterized protein n=1 Tax=uncultured Caudovirales phage TaxID=2100421 RepID=A0A6J5N163_9CAUD|nr:hypothetical protein UFOVP606_8 [uncultured Caudovirales phage]
MFSNELEISINSSLQKRQYQLAIEPSTLTFFVSIILPQCLLLQIGRLFISPKKSN